MIPDYQSVMLPLLKYAGDKEEHHIRDAIERLADEFKLTEEERKKLLPSGLQAIFNIQAKKWENPVSRPEIHKFAGALQGKRARKGIFITTSKFSKSSIEYVSMIENKIILIDGEQLAKLMIEHDVGVSTIALYTIKKIDSDYFMEA
jgi:restriction endonuclease Mrr